MAPQAPLRLQPVLVLRRPAPAPRAETRVRPAPPPAPRWAAPKGPSVTPAAITGIGRATTVTVIAGGGTTLTCKPADLTVGPTADIGNFTIMALDAGRY
jgi:hypothetical protein